MNPKRVALMAEPFPAELFTVSINVWAVVKADDEESATSMLKLNVPDWLVVPESEPADCTAMPLGSVPEARAQVYGDLPPLALNAPEYEVPAVASDKDAVVITRGGGGGAVTVTNADADLVESAALVAVTVAIESVVTVGARYSPAVEMVPIVSDQLTAVLGAFDTNAVNEAVPADATVAVAGVTVTTTADDTLI